MLEPTITKLEQMNIVIVGHVDHGKSTLIGRLLADTGSLPEGKLEAVKATCKRNAKPFEYAFLLDALKDEQSQGITIDTARCFFNTDKRHYIIMDAPGHIEFLKNMITGAARAEAALLLIDAHEGVQENSRRHGFMLSLLGIRQVVVLVNKMDLVDYDKDVYDRVVREYTDFLNEINVTPKTFVPISAREGKNLVELAPEMPWYSGKCVLDLIDDFEKEKSKEDQPFRFPVQDVYKFTQALDDRRIVAGTVETGTISVGEEVVFLPSGKQSRVKSIESFNTPTASHASAGQAIGFTLDTQIYIKPGELMVRPTEKTVVSSVFKANIFWLGRKPMVMDKKYKLKLATSRSQVYLGELLNVMDASNLETESNKREIERHDVAECVLETLKPVAFDLSSDIESTGRFVIIDDYEIAGGGIIIEALEDRKTRLDQYLERRNFAWEKSQIRAVDRAARFSQKPKFVVVTGAPDTGKMDLAKGLEKSLFEAGRHVYYLGISNMLSGLGSSGGQAGLLDRDEHIRQLGELVHLFTEAGLIVISTISDLDDDELTILKTLGQPNDMIVVNVGEKQFNTFPVDVQIELATATEVAVKQVGDFLVKQDILLEYNL